MKLRLITLCLLLAACTPLALTPTDEPTRMPTVSDTPEPSPITPGESPVPREPVKVDPTPLPVVGEIPSELWEGIAADLEARTGASRAAFTIIQAEAVEWNDGSLGCPQPGVDYLQATQEGYRIVIEWNGQQFDYRAGRRGYFTLCKTPVINEGTLPPTVVFTLPKTQQP